MARMLQTVARWLFGLVLQTMLLPWTLLVGPSKRRKETDESYAVFDHMALNVTRPSTEWLNMGDWTKATDLPTASRHLAERLYSAVDIQPGAAILDVGHGCGDSLLLLMEKYEPSVLHGVTSMPAHAARARRRIEASRGDRNSHISIHCDDAVPFVERLAEQEQPERYDVILALDCAYHFNTRRRFLRACNRILKPGGTIALQDLIASHPYPRQASIDKRFIPTSRLPAPTSDHPTWRAAVQHAIVLRLTGVPSYNILSAYSYLAHVDQADLEDARMQDVSHAVFPGFARFLRQLGTGEEKAWRGGGVLQWTALRAFGNTVADWAQGGDKGMVRSVVVTAKRRRAIARG